MREYKYTPDPELQRLAAQEREIRIAYVMDQGVSRELATAHIAKLDEICQREFEKMIMERGSGGPGALHKLVSRE